MPKISKFLKIFLLSMFIFSSYLISSSVVAKKPAVGSYQSFVGNYSEIVLNNYEDALTDALAMQKAIGKFLKKPSSDSLLEAQEAWLVARNSYGQTEVFRFYEGPIDFVNQETGEEGPEGRLNAWPLNEAYIDYVKGNKLAGIINSEVAINKDLLKSANQKEDEADVATGYHAIEFLLWGQDLSLNSAGVRPYTDFISGDKFTERRRAYLSLVTEILVEDLEFLVTEWKDQGLLSRKLARENFRTNFENSEPKQITGLILTSLATLAGFELSSERLATALDSGDQEDEHSCFSDNTHNDFIYNLKGIANVYYGDYESIKSIGVADLLKESGDDGNRLATKIDVVLQGTSKIFADLPTPIDREVLAKPKGHKNRVLAEKAVSNLQELAKLFVEAGDVLGVKAEILE